MTRLGLLLTLTEPPPAMEEEFNASVKVLSSPAYPGARALILNNEIRNALQVRRFVSDDGERITQCELASSPIPPDAGIVYRLYES